MKSTSPPFLSLRWQLLIGFVWSCGSVSCSTVPLVEGSKKALAVEQQAAHALVEAEALYAHALDAPEMDDSRRRYHDAIRRFLTLQQRLNAPRDWPDRQLFVFQGRQIELVLETQPDPLKELPPRIYETLQPADQIKLDDTTAFAEGPGLGLPLVASHQRTPELTELFPFTPPCGFTHPCTAILEFTPGPSDRSPIQAQLRLVNTRMTREVRLRGTSYDVAWNLSAPLTLAFGKKSFAKLALTGLLRPGDVIENAQIYRLNVYRKDQIPVVLVHGLKSDPHIWHQTVNAIYSDPVLRDRYQVWFFLYPTGLPIPTSAGLLRQSLNRVRQHFDPQRTSTALDQMVVVGHSMGGLLTRLQVSDSGNTMWEAFFRVPPEQLLATQNQRNNLTNKLFFEANDDIDRAIFVATPHRGSRLADLSIVRWATHLIRLPTEIATTVATLPLQNFNMLNPVLFQFDSFGTLGVENLSPEHPFFTAIETMRLEVPHHSIIGDRGKGDTPNSSDGVVPYRSSHLDSAASEVIVPYGHGCTSKPETVAEIARILHLHLKE